MAFRSITQLCQEHLRAHLRPGDWALDATAGNGHDTVALAEAVGPTGRVFAIDRQAVALRATRVRLAAAGLARQVDLRQGDHAELARLLPEDARGRLRLAVFNLGYLPGGDKAVTTATGTTLRALAAALDWLTPGGLLAIVCYPGHDEGAREARAVTEWVHAIAAAGAHAAEEHRVGPTLRPAPFLLLLRGVPRAADRG